MTYVRRHKWFCGRSFCDNWITNESENEMKLTVAKVQVGRPSCWTRRRPEIDWLLTTLSWTLVVHIWTCQPHTACCFSQTFHFVTTEMVKTRKFIKNFCFKYFATSPLHDYHIWNKFVLFEYYGVPPPILRQRSPPIEWILVFSNSCDWINN